MTGKCKCLLPFTEKGIVLILNSLCINADGFLIVVFADVVLSAHTIADKYTEKYDAGL